MNKRPGSKNSVAIVLAFFAVYFIWGTTYLASIVGLESIKPFVLSALRYVAAAILLGGYMIVTKKFRVDRRSLVVLAISGSLMLAGGSGLVVYGEQYVNSGYAAVIVATEPLWFILLDKKRWKFYLLALLLGEWGHFNSEAVSMRAWSGLVFLVLFGSLIAYVAFNWLLTVRPPAIVSTHTYVNPVVAVAIGGAIGGEHLSGQQVLALCVVLIAVIVTQLSKQKALGKVGLEVITV
jgi:drug/metabolite transporter (DMT)-like permease